MAIHIYLADQPEYSELVATWNFDKNPAKVTPDRVKSGSPDPVWWKCAKCHEWQASPLSRSRGGNGCPVCMSRKVMSGFNDLATLNPTVAAEWHPSKNNGKTPADFMVASNVKVWWLCPVGGSGPAHEWITTINSRNSGSGCPFCSNRLVLTGFNDLASSEEHKEIIAEWHADNDVKPTEVGVASNKKVKWKCAAASHEWDAVIANRTKKGSGCPECRKGAKVTKRETVAESKLAPLWHPENKKSATEVTVGSTYEAKWQCTKDHRHVWNATIANQMRSSECPVCTGKKIIIGVNDLTSFPEYEHLVREWSDENTLKPYEVSPGTDTPIKWKCSLNKEHTWKTSLFTRTKRNAGCPECVGRSKRIGPGKKISDFPALLKQWHKDNAITPDQVPFRSRLKLIWTCGRDSRHVFICAPDHRKLDGSDCPVRWSRCHFWRQRSEVSRYVEPRQRRVASRQCH